LSWLNGPPLIAAFIRPQLVHCLLSLLRARHPFGWRINSQQLPPLLWPRLSDRRHSFFALHDCPRDGKGLDAESTNSAGYSVEDIA